MPDRGQAEGPLAGARYGLIAGGGRFPFMVLDAARAEGRSLVTVAIKEEADPAIEAQSETCHWISLGELSKLIRIFREEGVRQAVMAGRVQHKQIFSAIRPDWRLVKVLAALRRKNTDSLLGAVVSVLADEGVDLIDSTLFLKPYLATSGSNSKREPNKDELADIAYGREVAAAVAGFDIGQSVVICDRACVAVEAMEGTDQVIERAATLVQGRRLTVVKRAKPNQDMRFDVPVIGPTTIRKMRAANATALAVEAGKTLLIDRDELLAEADTAKIAVWGFDA
ncbi:MAG: UDP-2,3-diacylglucosamine diphosphatase LpxI [Bryobacterales bacterium]